MKNSIPRKLDLIVVLGMHRSGTSAITRGLEVMGVELGNNLMPAMAGVNTKGFFEDLDLVDFNISLLDHLGMDWHDASPVADTHVADLVAAGLLLKAADLMRQKIAFKRPYGIKDPRLAKLIPFWKKVFEHCELDVGYVIALRNPISVAKSLNKRDGFAFEKSYLLWLDHVLSALIQTEGTNRVFIDFDLVIENPAKHLGRLARAFDLSVNSDSMSEYVREFLDDGLRHNIDQPQDLAIDPRIPQMVRDLYPMLRTGADMDQQFSLSDKQLDHYTHGRAQLHAPIVYVDQLHQAAAIRDGELATLNQAVAERDGQLITLNQAVADRDGQLITLNQAVAERDGQLITLNQAVADRDGQLITLNQAVADLNQKISNLREQAENFGRIVESAKHWQKRSWAKRAFHRWRGPNGSREKKSIMQKFKKSFGRRFSQTISTLNEMGKSEPTRILSKKKTNAKIMKDQLNYFENYL